MAALRAAQRTGAQLRAAREPRGYSGGRPALLPPNPPPAGWQPPQAPGRRAARRREPPESPGAAARQLQRLVGRRAEGEWGGAVPQLRLALLTTGSCPDA